MATILKPLFEVLTGNVAVMDNVLYNYIFLLLVGEIAFRVAWSFVGDLYRIGVIDRNASGSIIHWIVRLIAYFVCAYLIKVGILLYKFIIAVPYWIWWLLLGTFLAIMLVSVAVIFYCKREVRVQNDNRY